MNTLEQYDKVVEGAKSLFMKKTRDYGTSWRILRPSSLTDQLFIKANRIRTIQETGENKVGDDVGSEFIAILNYSYMALIQLSNDAGSELELPLDVASNLYDKYRGIVRDLMLKKNHDYGEAWRDMRVSSLTDLILTKILRIKQIENNKGKTEVSEGADANYMDIANYAIFALILLEYDKNKE